jgi:Sporulation and spore germination
MTPAATTRTLSPSKSSTAPEPGLRRPVRWIGFALLVGIACCSQGSRRLDDLRSTSSTERVRVFLVDRQSGGAAAAPVACNPRVLPVEVTLLQKAPALEGSFAGLFSLGRDPYDTGSGLYNALHASPLALDRIERRGVEALVYLQGYVELDGPCDGERALAQLTATALQFPDVQRVQLFLDGKPLPEVLRP